MLVHSLPAMLGPGELLDLIADTTFFGKGILLTLMFLSVMSWAVFFDKVRTLSRIRNGHVRFWNHCDTWLEGNTNSVELEEWCGANTDLPLCNLILETSGAVDTPGIRRAAERVSYLEIENLEKYLILLSTAVTISPFLGLLGTVWGIMSSFWDMASMHSANLTVVAPGIAEALVTTIAGLSTAIPAVIFYNMLVRKIDLVGNELERLRTILEESAGGGRGSNGPAGRDIARRPGWHDREMI
ncbi:MAG: MotA/TolQ/ExbB proton channel family protein [Gemmatimonadales bacterium]|nr:MotA/TolQ/ExbB proton channel family protein [Gemmatimonadales bacterium]